MANGSVVDYLNSQNKDSSYGNRAKLASQYGITGYQGTAQQNTQLLNRLQNGQTSSPTQNTTQQSQTTSTSNAVQNQNADLQKAMDSYSQFLRGSSDGYYNQQKAMLDSAKSQNLTELQQALDRAVADGELSREEARRQYADNVDAINEQNYLNSEAIAVSANERGINNSQQLLGLEQGNQRFAGELRNEAQLQRDQRINEIKTRINNIKNDHNLNVANVNQQYNANLRQAQGEATQMYNQGMGQMAQQQVSAGLQLRNNLVQMGEQQRNALEQMEAQQHYNLQSMRTQYGYDMERMTRQMRHDANMLANQIAGQEAVARLNNNLELERMEKQYEAQAKQINDDYELQRSRTLAQFEEGTPEWEIAQGQINQAEQQAMNQLHTETTYNAVASSLQPGTQQYADFMDNPRGYINDASNFSPENVSSQNDSSWLSRARQGVQMAPSLMGNAIERWLSN